MLREFSDCIVMRKPFGFYDEELLAPTTAFRLQSCDRAFWERSMLYCYTCGYQSREVCCGFRVSFTSPIHAFEFTSMPRTGNKLQQKVTLGRQVETHMGCAMYVSILHISDTGKTAVRYPVPFTL
jgi:hypothetical protein